MKRKGDSCTVGSSNAVQKKRDMAIRRIPCLLSPHQPTEDHIPLNLSFPQLTSPDLFSASTRPKCLGSSESIGEKADLLRINESKPRAIELLSLCKTKFIQLIKVSVKDYGNS